MPHYLSFNCNKKHFVLLLLACSVDKNPLKFGQLISFSWNYADIMWWFDKKTLNAQALQRFCFPCRLSTFYRSKHHAGQSFSMVTRRFSSLNLEKRKELHEMSSDKQLEKINGNIPTNPKDSLHKSWSNRDQKICRPSGRYMGFPILVKYARVVDIAITSPHRYSRIRKLPVAVRSKSKHTEKVKR
uniref:Uncharacterized protein n=1 Tax=Parascaris univalens TaxID=6257 RepID=A0A915CI29_PARUN